MNAGRFSDVLDAQGGTWYPAHIVRFDINTRPGQPGHRGQELISAQRGAYPGRLLPAGHRDGATERENRHPRAPGYRFRRTH